MATMVSQKPVFIENTTNNNNNNTVSPPKSPIDNLPKAFVSSLKVLFDILDEDRDGMIALKDIETRWKGEDVNGVPPGVLEALKKVTPKTGRLSFERFCTGLKISLINSKFEKTSNGKPQEEKQHPNTATVRPNNVILPMQRERSKSASHLMRAKPLGLLETDLDKTDPGPDHKRRSRDHPSRRSFGHANGGPRKPGDYDNGRWIADVNRNKQDIYQVPASRVTRSVSSISSRPPSRSSLDGHWAAPSNQGKEKLHGGSGQGIMIRPKSGRREDPRRHTLSSGIDYNMLKRMKAIEQERDILLQGLEVIERTKDWYQKELNLISRQMNNRMILDRSDTINPARQEKAAYKRARIQDINLQLTTLVQSSEMGFPDHMNLAVDLKVTSPASGTVNQLRQQNRLLTNEVSQKSEMITKLNQEKSALIRELFEARGRTQRELPTNTTFL
ncbi:suppressor APC domain-containing protein 2-like [Anneissia japonica]|uniref:suppressor APC domain-containing protein 2-like n=1 Tax=Anneissia japonica TaxID=1529436 RepID=UPI001425B016|nr:suppressor APC domain-containing protein 2-like [Anneissia japonica]